MLCVFSDVPYFLVLFFLCIAPVCDPFWNMHVRHGIIIFLNIWVIRSRIFKRELWELSFQELGILTLSIAKLLTLDERRAPMDTSICAEWVTLLKYSYHIISYHISYLWKRFFPDVTSPSHKLNKLVLPRRLPSYNVRSQVPFQPLKCRTNRFMNSFIPTAIHENNML